MPPPDDSSIKDETDLFRRVPRVQVIADDNLGRLRPSSGHFSHREMSIVLGDTLLADSRTPKDALGPRVDDFLVALVAGFVREEEQSVVRSPNPEEPAHGDVVGHKPKSRQRRFATVAEWVIPPPEDFQPPSGS